jgi:SAM-dependent methyltransferase
MVGQLLSKDVQDGNPRVNHTSKASYQAVFYPESAFGGFSDIDGTVAFYSRINALIQPSFRMADFGCGRGAHAEDPITFRRGLTCFKGKVAKVIGLDVDSAGRGNPTVDAFRLLAPDGPWPLENKSADLVICDSVLEHLHNPESFFCEAVRVLAPGGYLCIRTPNVLSYVGIASKLVPNEHHKYVLARTQLHRGKDDVFPTLYRCNTVFAVKRQLTMHGFRAAVYGYEAEPSYLHFSKLAYGLGVLHQKLAPGFLRPTIFAFSEVL